MLLSLWKRACFWYLCVLGQTGANKGDQDGDKNAKTRMLDVLLQFARWCWRNMLASHNFRHLFNPSMTLTWCHQSQLKGSNIGRPFEQRRERDSSFSWSWARTAQCRVWSFLELAGHYRRFVKDFSTFARPLTALLKKNILFRWNEACQHSFERLKDALTITYVLTLLIRSGDYIVYSYVSR